MALCTSRANYHTWVVGKSSGQASCALVTIQLRHPQNSERKGSCSVVLTSVAEGMKLLLECLSDSGHPALVSSSTWRYAVGTGKGPKMGFPKWLPPCCLEPISASFVVGISSAVPTDDVPWSFWLSYGPQTTPKAGWPMGLPPRVVVSTFPFLLALVFVFVRWEDIGVWLVGPLSSSPCQVSCHPPIVLPLFVRFMFYCRSVCVRFPFLSLSLSIYLSIYLYIYIDISIYLYLSLSLSPLSLVFMHWGKPTPPGLGSHCVFLVMVSLLNLYFINHALLTSRSPPRLCFVLCLAVCADVSCLLVLGGAVFFFLSCTLAFHRFTRQSA